MKYALCIAGVAAIVVLVWAFAYDPRQCLTGHMESRHRDAWTQYVPVGKVVTFIYHPEMDYKEFVCDVYFLE